MSMNNPASPGGGGYFAPGKVSFSDPMPGSPGSLPSTPSSSPQLGGSGTFPNITPSGAPAPGGPPMPSQPTGNPPAPNPGYALGPNGTHIPLAAPGSSMQVDSPINPATGAPWGMPGGPWQRNAQGQYVPPSGMNPFSPSAPSGPMPGSFTIGPSGAHHPWGMPSSQPFSSQVPGLSQNPMEASQMQTMIAALRGQP